MSVEIEPMEAKLPTAVPNRHGLTVGRNQVPGAYCSRVEAMSTFERSPVSRWVAIFRK